MGAKIASTALLALCVAGGFAVLAGDPPPGLINYQGVLRSSAGAPLSGDFDMTFRFFGTTCNCCDGSSAIGCNDDTCEAIVCAMDSFCCNICWDNICAGEAMSVPECVACCTENEILKDAHIGGKSVAVTGGLFNVALGGGTLSDGAGPGVYSSLADVFREQSAVELEVTIAGETLSPRTRVLSSAYAISARKADPPCHGGPGNLDRFVDCGNGTVTDTVTGLTWLRDAACAEGDFWLANTFAEKLAHGQCGLTDGSAIGDWRLPTKEEWQAVIDQANMNDCMSPSFPDTHGLGCCVNDSCEFYGGIMSGMYWSSSTIAASPDFAWRANLNAGMVTFGGKGSTAYIWAVRRGS